MNCHGYQTTIGDSFTISTIHDLTVDRSKRAACPIPDKKMWISTRGSRFPRTKGWVTPAGIDDEQDFESNRSRSLPLYRRRRFLSSSITDPRDVTGEVTRASFHGFPILPAARFYQVTHLRLLHWQYGWKSFLHGFCRSPKSFHD